MYLSVLVGSRSESSIPFGCMYPEVACSDSVPRSRLPVIGTSTFCLLYKAWTLPFRGRYAPWLVCEAYPKAVGRKYTIYIGAVNVMAANSPRTSPRNIV
jgi:hypothetical protein